MRGGLIAIALMLAPAALHAAVPNFTIVNATGLAIQTLEVRRFGTDTWKPLSAAADVGARSSVSFNDPDCAFDIRARLAGGVQAVWSGVNLCEVKSVTLNRSASGALWVDYD